MTARARITDTFDGFTRQWVQDVDPDLLKRWRRNGKEFTTNPDGTVTVVGPEHVEVYEFLNVHAGEALPDGQLMLEVA